MCGFTRLSKMRNVMISEKARVALIEDKMRETRQRCFEHVKRRSVDAPVRMILYCAL